MKQNKNMVEGRPTFHHADTKMHTIICNDDTLRNILQTHDHPNEQHDQDIKDNSQDMCEV